jgi:hypothetical protein
VCRQVVAVDDLIALDHLVRAVWAFAAGLDLSPLAGAPGGPPRPTPALLVALWLWAAIEGIGNARHSRACAKTISRIAGFAGVSRSTIRP